MENIDLIKTIFKDIANLSEISIQLLNIKTSEKTGIGYSSREVSISSEEERKNLFYAISSVNLKKIDECENVIAYDGSTNAKTIYTLGIDNELIANAYNKFIEVIANPDTESDPFSYKSAYLIKGSLEIEQKTRQIKLISMQKPIVEFKQKHQYFFNKGNLTQLKDKVISLRPSMDMVIVNDVAYFLTMAGENLFGMERAYKKICRAKVEEIEKLDIIDNINVFKETAESGHNPRRFVAFNSERLEALKDKNKSSQVMNRFGISFDEQSNKLKVTSKTDAEKIIKLLCNKGMTDPFNNEAVEVDSARKWQK